jgi:hypothetical protein
MYFVLPGIGKSGLSLRSDKREYPLYCGERVRSKVEHKVTLPASVKEARLVPGSLRWEGPAGLGTVSVDARLSPATGGVARVLEITRELNYAPAIIPPVYYPALRDMDKQVGHPDNRTVLLTLEEGKPAPAKP